MCEFEGWASLLEPAYLLWKPADHDYERPCYMTRPADDDEFTPQQEYAKMTEQVNNSDGFDIDFSYFRCVFNYHPAVLDSRQFVDEPETTKDLLNRLAKGSLDEYNQTNNTEFEFVKVVRANYHFAGAIMFLITFHVKDPYDDQIKLFQARVRHAEDIVLEYIFCRPEPNQGEECVGTAKTHVEKDLEKDTKKQRLEKDVEKDV